MKKWTLAENTCIFAHLKNKQFPINLI